MRTYAVIQAEIAEFEAELKRLRQEAKEAKAREVEDARKRVAEIMKTSGLKAEDLLKSGPKEKSNVIAIDSKDKHPPKYQEPATGKTWSGRGRCPDWLVDQPDREKFRIPVAA